MFPRAAALDGCGDQVFPKYHFFSGRIAYLFAVGVESGLDESAFGDLGGQWHDECVQEDGARVSVMVYGVGDDECVHFVAFGQDVEAEYLAGATRMEADKTHG